MMKRMGKITSLVLLGIAISEWELQGVFAQGRKACL